jgi:hypothetical protein
LAAAVLVMLEPLLETGVVVGLVVRLFLKFLLLGRH